MLHEKDNDLAEDAYKKYVDVKRQIKNRKYLWIFIAIIAAAMTAQGVGFLALTLIGPLAMTISSHRSNLNCAKTFYRIYKNNTTDEELKCL